MDTNSSFEKPTSQFLPQRRWDAEEAEGGDNLPANETNTRESLVGLDRRADPRFRRERAVPVCRKTKRNSPLHLGSLINRALASRRRTPNPNDHALRKCQYAANHAETLHRLV